MERVEEGRVGVVLRRIGWGSTEEGVGRGCVRKEWGRREWEGLC